MKKSTKLTILISAIVAILGIAVFCIWKSRQPALITDHDYLYDTAIQYKLDHDTDPYKGEKPAYHRFADYKGFGIAEDSHYYYAYMWILDEAYYVNAANHLRSYTGGSMPYKFRFDKQTSEVIDYEIPEDGSGYAPSIRKMFPSSVAKKILATSSIDDSKLKSEVKEYYSYLDDTEIYYTDYDDNEK